MSYKIILNFAFAFLLASESYALPSGSAAPDFKLQSIEGKTVSLSDYTGKVVVLEWYNSECPFVKKHYEPGNMQSLQNKWQEKDVVWLTIDSTNPQHANYRDAKKLQEIVAEQKIANTALLSDPEGKVGKLYQAATTPHMFIVDKKGKLVYQGAIDDNPDAFAKPASAKNYVDLALSELTAGKKVGVAESKAYGCSVKY